jgi:hypothetical protein
MQSQWSFVAMHLTSHIALNQYTIPGVWNELKSDCMIGKDAMSIFSRLFGSKADGGHEPPSMPWDQRPSILEFVRSKVARDKPGMTEDGYTLPDEERIGTGSKIRWAAGASVQWTHGVL